MAGDCQESQVGDGICHAENNNAKCEFDGGDCCSGLDGQCQHCFPGESCRCHETGEHRCYVKCIEDDKHNGVCDAINNVEVCEYDGGDCCLANDMNYCTNCLGDECLCKETGLRHCILSGTQSVML